jgi:serine/threonine protein kinase
MWRVRGHPNVVEMYDYYEDRGAFWIVCELCESRVDGGGSLMFFFWLVQTFQVQTSGDGVVVVLQQMHEKSPRTPTRSGTGGELMERIIKAQSFSERTASQYFKHMLTGLQWCHQHNVVHRDLK